MAEIKVQDLSIYNISGTDLFSDSESFMVELTDEQDRPILGGQRCTMTCIDDSYACQPNSCYRTAQVVNWPAG